MAAQSKKSILGSQYGNGGDLAVQIAQDTSLPSAGFQDPPPGIRDGKGQLDEVKFELYKTGKNEGKPYFTAIGVIREPLAHTYTPTSKGKTTGADPVTVTTEGMQTRIRVDIFDRKVESGPNMGKVISWQEGAKEAAQHMRALGADTSKVRQLSDLETIAETLTKVARDPNTPIFFKFSTSTRKAQNEGELDGSWTNWHGTAGLENYTPPDSGAATVDESDTADTSFSQETDGTEDDNDVSTASLDALVALAKNEEGDETPAQNELLRRAVEASGQSEDAIRDKAESWDEVAGWANGEKFSGDGSEEAPEEDAGPQPPKKGDHVNYRPTTKKMGKMVKAQKPVECSVTTVNVSKETVTLKNTVDGKTEYKDVPWSDLEDIT